MRARLFFAAYAASQAARRSTTYSHAERLLLDARHWRLTAE